MKRLLLLLRPFLLGVQKQLGSVPLSFAVGTI